MKPDKYALYELSVQSAKDHVDWTIGIFRDLRGLFPRTMREDFCGTFKLSQEWVKRNRRNRAIAVDLDPEPLAYGRRHHYARLRAEQKLRLSIVRGDVTRVRTPAADLILVGNFSFFVFKRRAELIAYFRNCRRGLGARGVLLLEMAGGPGMIHPMRERRVIRRKNGAAFTYVWDQSSFDPVTHAAKYFIHFKFADGSGIRRAFTYDWRLWTIPEVRDALAEAGFADSHVYWETAHRGRGTGEFARVEQGDNAYSWIAYVAGIK